MRQWTVDAFATQAFRGNPASVTAPMAAWASDAWMQALAAENNQAETAFLKTTDDPARFGLRWFTPTVEVPLCGHATLASAHVLFAELGLDADLVTFDTLSGPLTARRVGELYEMDFPASPPRQIDPPAGLAQALGFVPDEVWAAQFIVAVVKDEAVVRAARPDLGLLKAVVAGDVRGEVAVCALADSSRPYEVVSRFFAPGVGIPEDAATGSLHCLLSPMFSARLGKPVVKFHQAYPGRGGNLECEHRGERVLLRGGAVTVVDGVLRVEPR